MSRLLNRSFSNCWSHFRVPVAGARMRLTLILLLIAAVYAPVRQAGFVWDDLINFVDNDWLTEGDQWLHYVLRDYNDWTNYFRPLVIAAFTVQLRLFETPEQTMHLVSLALHLANTFLVSIVTWQLCRRSSIHKSLVRTTAVVAGAVYGLHPALTEAVAWIGCQFDLFAVLFMLAAAALALSMSPGPARSTVVSMAFFLAACSKESAAALPLLVLGIDWVSRQDTRSLPLRTQVVVFLNRNTGLLVGFGVAALVYLNFRYFALGHLVEPTPFYGGDVGIVGHINRVLLTLREFAMTATLPIRELSPIYDVDPQTLNSTRLDLVAVAALTVGTLLVALYRLAAFGCLWSASVVAFVVGLLPVLNLLPTGFAVSLYHDRYLITSLAFSIPLLATALAARGTRTSPRHLTLGVIGVWLALSTISIRSTLPHWQNDRALWERAHETNPLADLAQLNLISALLRENDLLTAESVTLRIYDLGDECVQCAISTADAFLDAGDLEAASRLLALARDSREVTVNPEIFGLYMLSVGHLSLAEREWTDAIVLLDEGLKYHPAHLVGHVHLAEALAAAGELEEAEEVARRALSLGDEDHGLRIAEWFHAFVKRLSATPSQSDRASSDLM